jgi:2-amino-4-hydroxy-6-hydroxymethyldihydropteridine diphosphokinase
MTTAYIGLGSNVGDRLRTLALAVDGIAHVPETHVEAVSRAYESEPAYDEDQPAFLNAVVKVETGLEADALLLEMQQVENDLGRVRERTNGPRTIDLDILLFGREEWQTESLTIPHPGLAERDFVVTPLLQIEPRITLPDGTHLRRSNATVGEVVRDLGEIPDAGVEHNMPVDADEWVAVASSEGPQSALGGFDAELDFKRSVLEQEGIPYAWQPFAPGAEVDVFGRPQVIELAVPASYAERALALLESVEAAAPIEPVEAAAEESVMHGGDLTEESNE